MTDLNGMNAGQLLGEAIRHIDEQHTDDHAPDTLLTVLASWFRRENKALDDYDILPSDHTVAAARAVLLEHACHHEHVTEFRSYPPRAKCLDCGHKVTRRWALERPQQTQEPTP